MSSSAGWWKFWIDGRVSLSLQGNAGQDGIEIKYQLLNTATYFEEIVNSARSIILAGGTMSPVSRILLIISHLFNTIIQVTDFTNQLLAHLDSEKQSTFACGHIIPSANLQTIVIRKGPSGNELEIKHQRQNDDTLVTILCWHNLQRRSHESFRSMILPNRFLISST